MPDMAAAPHSLTLTYPDGTTVQTPFEGLPGPLREELLRQPGLHRPGDPPAPGPFLLLEWEDGWREVIGVDSGSTGIKRYYVITRSEDVGRLALEHESGYPELVEISRRPFGLRRITLDGTFEVTPERSVREGGKTDSHFSLERRGDAFAELIVELAEAGGDPGGVGLVAGKCGRDLQDFVVALAGRTDA
ncbi:MAG: hypothetical protein ACYC6T_01085 [Thermoleophilia bacterium]